MFAIDDNDDAHWIENLHHGIGIDDDDSDEGVFIVEKILDRKKEGRRILYLVKWEGFEEKDATWEPVSNLGNVKELVREYD